MSDLPNIKIVIRELTPALAKELLSRTVINRKISRARVDQYKRLILAGEWRFTSNHTMAVSKKGALLDGQHRCMAVVEAGKTIFVILTYGWDDDVFPYLDRAAGRTASDTLSTIGCPAPNITASVIRSYFLQNTGVRAPMNYSSSDNTVKLQGLGVGRGHILGTNAAVLNEYQQYRVFFDNITKLARCVVGKYKLFPAGFVGGFAAILIKGRDYDFERVEKFLKQLFAIEPDQNSVTEMLRDKMIKDALSTKRMSGTLRNALMIKCWNVWVTDKQIKALVYNEKDPFPQII